MSQGYSGFFQRHWGLFFKHLLNKDNKDLITDTVLGARVPIVMEIMVGLKAVV